MKFPSRPARATRSSRFAYAVSWSTQRPRCVSFRATFARNPSAASRSRITSYPRTAAVAPADAGPRLEPTKGAAGIGDPYFTQDGNGGIDVLHYDVHDRYGFGSGRLAGTTKLEVRATQELSRFKDMVRQHDPQAFLVVTETLEVMGKGIGNQPHW